MWQKCFYLTQVLLQRCGIVKGHLGDRECAAKLWASLRVAPTTSVQCPKESPDHSSLVKKRSYFGRRDLTHFFGWLATACRAHQCLLQSFLMSGFERIFRFSMDFQIHHIHNFLPYIAKLSETSLHFAPESPLPSTCLDALDASGGLSLELIFTSLISAFCIFPSSSGF